MSYHKQKWLEITLMCNMPCDITQQVMRWCPLSRPGRGRWRGGRFSNFKEIFFSNLLVIYSSCSSHLVYPLSPPPSGLLWRLYFAMLWSFRQVSGTCAREWAKQNGAEKKTNSHILTLASLVHFLRPKRKEYFATYKPFGWALKGYSSPQNNFRLKGTCSIWAIMNGKWQKKCERK